jgi:P-type Cu+ transporter
LPVTANLKITGMTCQNCARHVREALQSVPGVDFAEVDLDGGRAEVRGDADFDALAQAVKKAGYEAAPEEASELKKKAPGPAKGGSLT